MQTIDFKKFLPHLYIILGFIVLAAIYSYPAFSGKVMAQGDVMGWKAMSKEGMDYHEKTGENVLWSNSMFGGNPTYTYYVSENNNELVFVQELITHTLPKPANFIFITLLGFYILMQVLGINRWLSVAGAVAYAFSTYNPVIIAAGHETKILCVGYFPMVLAGILLIYRSDWWKGIPLLAISFALIVSAGHYQMIYYLVIIVLFAAVSLFITAVKEKKLKEFFVSSLVALVICIIAIGPNMHSMLPTLEYNKETMRGGNSELTITQHDDNKKSGGLDKEYAFRWSNGIGETFCLIVPYLYGGSSSEPIAEAPATQELIGDQAPSLPLYWGPQKLGISGPVYFGAVICFLFVLGMIVIKSAHKWWMLAVAILSIVMSWGDHFAAFNYFLFDNLPMLNKFRTPTMVLTIAQLIFPMVAIWGLQEILSGKYDKQELLKKLKIATGITAGLCLLLGVGGSMFFDFTGPNDGQMQKEIVTALRTDRAAMAMKSGLTSAILILVAAAIVWAFITDKIKSVTSIAICILAVISIDLFPIASHYLNEENFVDEVDYDSYFQPRPVDQQILQDKDPYYRVLDVTTDVYNDAKPAYFHKIIGGYSPAKMERYQDLIDVHMRGSFNSEVLNMLNTKYIIFNGPNNQPVASPNPGANGNAWFVEEIKWTKTADEEILSLNAGKIGDTAVVPNAFNGKHTAVVRDNFKNELNGYTFGRDSAAKIVLTKYGLNDLAFSSTNNQNGFAVFSDIYYDHGWKAYVDGKETPIVKANYLLRAIKIPAGTHKIEFKFHPASYYTGNTISLISSVFILLISAVSIFRIFNNKKKETA